MAGSSRGPVTVTPRLKWVWLRRKQLMLMTPTSKSQKRPFRSPIPEL
nr:hypothetical protein Iba_chr05fCG10850 [Ipomoea batatas]